MTGNVPWRTDRTGRDSRTTYATLRQRRGYAKCRRNTRVSQRSLTSETVCWLSRQRLEQIRQHRVRHDEHVFVSAVLRIALNLYAKDTAEALIGQLRGSALFPCGN